jgi:PAS domain S-box-containing protein
VRWREEAGTGVLGDEPGHGRVSAPSRAPSNRNAPTQITDDDLAGFLELPTELCGVFDPAVGLLWCNEAARQALGLSPDDLRGMAPREFLHPDDMKAVARLVLDLEPGAELAAIETRCLAKDGSWKWFEWAARRDDDSGLIFGVARDVTALHAQREALRADELQLQAIVDNSPSAIFVKDRLSRYVLVNDAFLHPIAMTAGDVIGKTAAEIWPDSADLLDYQRDARLLEQGDIETSDDQVELADGAHTFMTVRFPLRDGAGSIVGFAGITTDITERTRIEEALGERRRLLDTIVRASPDIVTIIDRTGRVTDISEASRTILGFDLENPVHEEVAALVHPDDVPGIYNQYSKLLTLQETRLDIRYRVKHRDGHWVSLDSRGQAIVADDGASGGVVVISRDVTADLEFEEQLRAAAGVAEHASEAKSDFLSRMSHELRTPLNSVLGFAQLLEMDGLPPQQEEAVGHILRAGRHLLNLIDEVLDIARIESGRLDLAVEPVGLASVLHDAVNLAGPLAEERDVEITLDLMSCPHDAHVAADRQRLLQVMLNLLSNGVKYNSTGGRVHVSAAPRDGERTAIAVTDTGPGIALEDIGRVFEPFDRLGAELTGIEGTGVGLTLSKYLVERMGGSIELQSQVDVGSTFTVELPNATAPVSTDDDGDTAVDLTGFKGTIRILHIEDNLANLELVEQVLSRRQPVELLAAMYGCLGLDLARAHRPDLILLDLHLPDMSGVDVLDELRRDPATKDTPVVIVSADATATQIRRLHGKGATAYLTKPIDIRELIRVVELVSSSIKAAS